MNVGLLTLKKSITGASWGVYYGTHLIVSVPTKEQAIERAQDWNETYTVLAELEQGIK